MFFIAGHVRHVHCLCRPSYVPVGHVIYVVTALVDVHTSIAEVFFISFGYMQ